MEALFFPAHCCYERCLLAIAAYNGVETKKNSLIVQIEKFLALSSEERKEMGLAGRRKVEKEFDRQIVVKKYLEELKEV